MAAAYATTRRSSHLGVSRPGQTEASGAGLDLKFGQGQGLLGRFLSNTSGDAESASPFCRAMGGMLVQHGDEVMGSGEGRKTEGGERRREGEGRYSSLR